MTSSPSRSLRALCGAAAAAILLFCPPKAMGQKESWSSYFEKAQAALANGDRQLAQQALRALLSSPSARVLPELHSNELMPLAVEVEARIMLAGLYASGSHASSVPRAGQEFNAKKEFEKALEIMEQKRVPDTLQVKVPLILRVRVHNEYGVFLLEQGQPAEALRVLDSVHSEANQISTKDRSAFGRYLYNLGRALLATDQWDKALGKLLQAYAEDPGFLPALETALEITRSASPHVAHRVLQDLTATALDSGDVLQAEDVLHQALARGDWSGGEAALSLVDLLARYFTEASLTSSAYHQTWEKEIQDFAAVSPELAQKTTLLAQAFTGTVFRCMEPKQVFKTYPLWADSERRRQTISRLLKMTADERFVQKDEEGAAWRYRLATCFDPSDPIKEYYANLLEYSVTQRAAFDSLAAGTHESILAAVAEGFERIGKPDLAAENFMAAAHKVAEKGDPLQAKRYLDRVNEQALPEERLAGLRVRQNEILQQASEAITVLSSSAGKPRIMLTSYRQTLTSSEPWHAVSGITPGVLPEQPTEAATETGQPETFVLPGSNPSGSRYSVDGVAVGSLSETPGPSTYYALDALEAIEVSLNSTDLDLPTLGGGINLVTKWPGARWNSSISHTIIPDQPKIAPEASTHEFASDQASTEINHIESAQETTLEVGGPLYKDRFLGLLFYSDSQTETRAVGGGLNNIGLRTAMAKISGNLGQADLLRLSLSRGSRDERGAGASLLRSEETTWSHTGDSDLWKLEYDHDTGNWQLSAHYAQTSSPSSFLPRERSADLFLSPDGIWKGGYTSLQSRPEADQWEGQATRALVNDRLAQKFELGARFRSLDLRTTSTFGNHNAAVLAQENLSSDFDVIRLYRSGRAEAELDQRAAWIQDTISLNRLTLSLGVRYDHQSGENTAAHAPANSLFPELVPGVRTGRSGHLNWEMITPRIGLTFTVFPDFLVLQANYSRFGSELDSRLLYRTNPAFQTYAQFRFQDSNDNGRLDPNEAASLFPQTGSGFDPRAPVASPHRNSQDLRPEITEELSFELSTPSSRGFQIGFAATFRRISRLLELRDLVRDANGSVHVAERSDYRFDRMESTMLPDGTIREVALFALKPDLAFTGGTLLLNGDREQTYAGLRLAFAGTFRENGQFRGYLSYDNWRWKIGPEFERFDDPNNLVQSLDVSGVSRADDDGDVVALQGSRGETDTPLLNSRWAFHLSGSSPLPFLGLTMGATLNVREGFPLPYYVTVIPSDGQLRNLQVVSRTDSHRLDDLILLDLRIEKSIDLGRMQATFSLDGFNLLNHATPLWRVRQLNSPQADFLTRTLNPLGIRLGARLSLPSWNG